MTIGMTRGASVPGGPAAAASSMSSPSSNSMLLYSTSFSPDLRIDKIHHVQKTHNSHKEMQLYYKVSYSSYSPTPQEKERALSQAVL